MSDCGMPANVGSNEGLGIAVRHNKPAYKLFAKVSTAQFRAMVAKRELRSSSWTASYRRPGNTVPVVHEIATLVVFGSGDDLFLCSPTQKTTLSGIEATWQKVEEAYLRLPTERAQTSGPDRQKTEKLADLPELPQQTVPSNPSASAAPGVVEPKP